jgi:GTP cyclohydrolase II
VHHECVPGEVLGAENCDCRTTLARALATIERGRCGIVVYLRRPSEPPPGLATQAQVVADILTDLGAAAVRLLPVARHTPDPGTALRARGLIGTAELAGERV